MGIFELAARDICAFFAKFELTGSERLSDSTTVMGRFRRGYWKGSVAQIGAWCGKNATQPEFAAASILKTGKAFRAGEAHWVREHAKERTRNKRSRNRLSFRAWGCTRALP